MTTTPQLPDAALSILASDLPDHSTATAVAAILLIAVITAALLYYVSPMRLTRVLVAAIVATEKTYLEALETGLLSASDVHTAEMLSTLELKVSAIREGTLRNSLSLGSTLREFCAGRTFTLLRCIREVHELETHIELDALRFSDSRQSFCPHSFLSGAGQLAPLCLSNIEQERQTVSVWSTKEFEHIKFRGKHGAVR
ncbi:hypothetical protein B0H13DRAFT_1857583 [Mycena leptocephala]|nr:hypothetical protein B0H13DRAFT_1857583 [Mycena leptocephala]